MRCRERYFVISQVMYPRCVQEQTRRQWIDLAAGVRKAIHPRPPHTAKLGSLRVYEDHVFPTTNRFARCGCKPVARSLHGRVEGWGHDAFCQKVENL